MRTTLVINDELLAEVKKRAADRKSNVSAIVNEALRLALKTEDSPVERQPFQIPTYRPGEVKPVDISPEDLYGLLVAEELGEYGR